MLDLDKLEKLKRKGEGYEARCPACAEEGRDRTGNHLFVHPDGPYKCVVAPEQQHTKRIFELAGRKDADKTRARPPRPATVTPKPSEFPAPAKVAPMAAPEKGTWDYGVELLRIDADACANIDTWRAWVPGTAQVLVDHGMMGTPLIYGKRCTAFVVMDAHGNEAGFHARHKPRDGERASWTFHPSGTPAIPFVLGSGHARTARDVFILEGQFDAVCIAAAAGWLAHETAWPDGVVVFGTRGAGGWRKLLEAWGAVIPKTARICLFPDEDEAGAIWTKPDGFRDTLRAHGFAVRVVRTGFKDFTDAHRGRPVTRENIEYLLTRGTP